jgi:hypothetical protein
LQTTSRKWTTSIVNRKLWDYFLFYGDSFLVQLSIAIFANFENTNANFSSFESIKTFTKMTGFEALIEICKNLPVNIFEIKSYLKAHSENL